MTQAAQPFAGLQRIVRKGGYWACSQHLVLSFPPKAFPMRFLNQFLSLHGPTTGNGQAPDCQISLGLSRRGLEALRVPGYVLASLANKAPAFSAGAAQRAARFAGASGRSLPTCWDKPFQFDELDAVVSVHAASKPILAAKVADITKLANDFGVTLRGLPMAMPLPRPQATPASPPPGPAAAPPAKTAREQWVHFGFRDGLARVGVHEWPVDTQLDRCKEVSRHHVGEFVLGYPQDSGANPWITGADNKVWPEVLRNFFRDGSFGVLQQIEQDVAAFETFVAEQARRHRMRPMRIKAKLCGRTPTGRALAAPANARPTDDFDYTKDKDGRACPFGSHVRRMNPRTGELPHSVRSRALLRRGMAYGPPWTGTPDKAERGLIGHFFCASIEDQFEHLLGQWADRVPMGSEDKGGARDPLIGAHDPRDGAFHIPRPNGPDLRLTGLQPFTRTRGTAYLFYPSLGTLALIAQEDPWLPPDKDEE